MRSWWGKSSSKETKKKTTKESFIDTLHRKFKSPSESKSSGRCGRTPRCISDTVSELGSLSRAESRSPSPSKCVARCQSFNDRPAQAQPLPLPNPIGRTDSGLSASGKPRSDKGFKASSFLPLPRPACIRHKPDPGDLDGELIVASISSECSIESEDQPSLMPRSPFASATGSPSSKIFKERSPAVQQVNLSPPTKRRPFVNHMPNLQVPQHGGAFFSAPGSPLRAFNNEQLKPYPDFPILGSGHCSSPGSGHNSMGGDMLFWQPSRGSPEYSPIPSPGPSSRIHSGAVTPLHPRAGCGTPETGWPDDGKQQSHRLPLPPVTISNSSPFPSSNSAATSPSVPRSPGRAENLTSPSPRWKKGKLLGRGTFGHVYEGFNSESGEMCAMKEVTLFSDDPKSKESAKQLAQEIAMLSRLRHPNIVQYYGSEMVGDRLYIYLEYVSGGSIYKLLQQYGEFGESAIRSYTRQILSGLAYLHAKNTVHRDIKGANILVDPNGRIKLADFGMAKHITGQSCPLSFKGSPYWMAPEVIKNSSGANLAVDIWSLGCTVLEMATSKPPWSQYEGVAAMFKIGNSKELPAIPDHLSEEGKDFVKLCLQRDPYRRPTAAKLLVHSFVRNAATMEKPSITATSSLILNGGIGPSRNGPASDSERLAIHSSRISKSKFNSSDIMIPRNISCPVSPIGSPLLHARSPQHLNGRMTPSPISSPRTTSPTRLTGGGTSTTLPSQHHNSPVFANMPKPSYWDLDGFRGVHTGGTHAYSEQDAKQFQRPTAYREFYDGQSVLADRVSQQLLKDHVKFTPSLDLNPSPLTGRTNGL